MGLIYVCTNDLSTHDLTRRSTISMRLISQYSHLSTHDLTRRSTRAMRLYLMGEATFNSRPHKEVDWKVKLDSYLPGLSTHDLTRRSTRDHHTGCSYRYLSTHDLTRRSTYENSSRRHGIYLSTHDLTRRSTTLYGISARTTRFQLTTSQGGRQGLAND